MSRGRPPKYQYFHLKNFHLLEEFVTYVYRKTRFGENPLKCRNCGSRDLKGAVIVTRQVGRYIRWVCNNCKFRWKDWLTPEDREDHYLARRLRKRLLKERIEDKLAEWEKEKKAWEQVDFGHTI